jgi:hypothetical protein
VKRYRKRPVVIEAQQILESDFMCDPPCARHVSGVAYDPGARTVRIATPPGLIDAEVGDWITRDICGGLGLCKADLFAERYEELAPPREGGTRG